MFRLILPVALTALLGVAVSCANDAFSPDGYATAPETPGRGDAGFFGFADGGTVDGEGICRKLGELRCDTLISCGLVPGSDAGEDACRAWLDSVACSAYGWTSRVRAGTLAVDVPRAEACALELMSSGCTEALEEPAACSDFLLPNRALGSDCYGGQFTECREGVCRGSGCPARCRERAEETGVCSKDEHCASGLYCAVMASGGIGTCARFSGATESCAFGYRCGEGLYCNAAEVCEARGARDAACAGDSCQAGLYCDGSGVCSAKLSEGESCTSEDACAEGLFCDASTARCASAAPLPEGASCSVNQSCAAGFTCVGATSEQSGTCSTPGAEGTPCERGEDCEVHLGCLQTDGGVSLCAQRQLLGGECDEPRDCPLTATCLLGECQAFGVPGDSCEGVPCLYGKCDRTDGGATCIGFAPPNAPCTEASECGSGSCVEGRCLAVCAP